MARPEPRVNAPGLTPELVLAAYAQGIFPMAEQRDSTEIYWIDPRRRGILPLDGFHVSRSLQRRARRGDYAITFDRDFAGVVAGCAGRPETWINDEIAAIYGALHLSGHAHSVEVWDGEVLAGGVYGVAIGSAFFGESMFSQRTDASKLGLLYLIDRLRQGRFTLFDTQFVTDHLASLGAVEIERRDYQRRLAKAIRRTAQFEDGPAPSADQVVQRMTQTS